MTGTDTAEAGLIERAKRGEDSALTEIVNRYSDKLYTLLVRMLRDPHEAEDALQETFLTMIEKISTFKGESQIYTWLYRIASNVALMKMRKQKGKQDVSIDEHEVTGRVHAGEMTPLPPNPEELAGNTELKQYIDKAVGNLPPVYRSVFILRDVEQQSTRETADLLGISEDNVKTRLRRARMMLRDELAEYLS